VATPRAQERKGRSLVVKSVCRDFLKAAGFLGLSVFVAGFADRMMEKFKLKMETSEQPRMKH
jgi:hypothetical protein